MVKFLTTLTLLAATASALPAGQISKRCFPLAWGSSGIESASSSVQASGSVSVSVSGSSSGSSSASASGSSSGSSSASASGSAAGGASASASGVYAPWLSGGADGSISGQAFSGIGACLGGQAAAEAGASAVAGVEAWLAGSACAGIDAGVKAALTAWAAGGAALNASETAYLNGWFSSRGYASLGEAAVCDALSLTEAWFATAQASLSFEVETCVSAFIAGEAAATLSAEVTGAFAAWLAGEACTITDLVIKGALESWVSITVKAGETFTGAVTSSADASTALIGIAQNEVAAWINAHGGAPTCACEAYKTVLEGFVLWEEAASFAFSLRAQAEAWLWTEACTWSQSTKISFQAWLAVSVSGGVSVSA